MKSTTAVIVGAGFGGLAMAYELKQRNVHDFVILERQPRVGGVWNENRYPGVACDIHSHLYCLSYFMNPRWSHEFAPGEEIFRYLEDFADHFEITPHIQFDTSVARATYEADTSTWTIDTGTDTYRASYFIAAVGQQNVPKYPSLPGLTEFAGRHFHSARWDLRARLIPTYPFLTKRVILSNDYLRVFNHAHVELVTDPLERIDGDHVVLRNGEHREVDVLISATGFHSTHFLNTLAITGRDRRELQVVWRDGLDAEAYLGTFVHGFPNMFVIFGPNTGVGGSSVTLMIEAQAQLIARCLEHMKSSGHASVEVRPDAQATFNHEIQAFMGNLVWTSDAATSWYKTDEGKVTTKWPYQPAEFERRTARLIEADFEFR
ncbi:MAG: NAD(P)/FAD-dependent oxidoreductase [Proteobacteria bacterium]|nr:NAD(P)/FAD-dependent oxidoreductase [Pseudomonadota bacterium]